VVEARQRYAANLLKVRQPINKYLSGGTRVQRVIAHGCSFEEYRGLIIRTRLGRRRVCDAISRSFRLWIQPYNQRFVAGLPFLQLPKQVLPDVPSDDIDGIVAYHAVFLAPSKHSIIRRYPHEVVRGWQIGQGPYESSIEVLHRETLNKTIAASDP